MIQPRRIGRFLLADDFGYVRPDVAIDRVGGVWQPLVDCVSRALMRRPGVRAVYIRGSIPRGLAIENVSDADFVYFSEIDFTPADAELEQAVAADFPFVQGLELLRLSRARFDQVHRPQRRPYFHMLVKTQCLLLAGDDVAAGIERFRIGPDMVSHVFWLASELSRLRDGLAAGGPAEPAQPMHRWFARRLLRAAFEVTMRRCNRFTRDLYLCYEQFAQLYPGRSDEMYRVLVNCLTGEDSPVRYEELVGFLRRESAGLLAP